MYRAKVEAVSGLKVRAGGKWLTCIGNRVFRAGDFVWTDGRCAYGHDRESQTPLVIVNPKEDLAVPLLFFDKIPTSKAQDITEMAFTFFSKPKIKSDYQDTMTRSIRQNLFMINNKSECHFHDVYLPRDLMRAALNLDNAHDFYEIRKSYLDEARFIVTILKNNATIAEIDCTPKMKELEKEAVTYARKNSGGSMSIKHDSWVIVYDESSLHLFRRDDVMDIPDGTKGYLVVKPRNPWGPIPPEYYGVEAGKAYFDASKEGVVIEKGTSFLGTLYPGRAENHPWYETRTAHSSVFTADCGIPWAVIENEDSWAFIFTTRAGATASGYSSDGKSKVVNVKARRSFLYTSKGVTELAFSLVSSSSGDTPQIQQKTYPVGYSIPIQDGFYFRINSMELYLNDERPQADEQNVATMNISVFNRDNKKLWAGNISAGTYLTICRNKGLLLGVDNRGGFGLFDTDFSSTSSINAKTSGVLDSGLYLIQDGKLEQILSGYLKNQKLRPMKRWKNWWEGDADE